MGKWPPRDLLSMNYKKCSARQKLIRPNINPASMMSSNPEATIQVNGVIHPFLIDAPVNARGAAC